MHCYIPLKSQIEQSNLFCEYNMTNCEQLFLQKFEIMIKTDNKNAINNSQQHLLFGCLEFLYIIYVYSKFKWKPPDVTCFETSARI